MVNLDTFLWEQEVKASSMELAIKMEPAHEDSHWDPTQWEVELEEEVDSKMWTTTTASEMEEYLEVEQERFLSPEEALPLLLEDGMVPQMVEREEEIVEQDGSYSTALVYQEAIPSREVVVPKEETSWVEEDWEWELEKDSKAMLAPLLQDPFIGCQWESENKEEELEEWEEEELAVFWEDDTPASLLGCRPRRAAFVVAERSNLIGSSSSNNNNIRNINTLSNFHHHQHHQNTPQPTWSNTQPTNLSIPINSNSSSITQFYSQDFLPSFHSSQQSSEGYYVGDEFNISGQHSDDVVQPNDFDQLLSIGEQQLAAGHHVYHQSNHFYEPISAPQSISSSDVSWAQHDSYTSESSSPSQDEILEEIHRECAEIEERTSSASPPDHTYHHTSTNSKAPKGHTRSKLRKDPYEVSPKKSARPTSNKEVAQSPEEFSRGEGGSPCSSTSGAPGGEKKKELNRIAATKYREKKRTERETAVMELRGLEGRNTQLRTEVSSMEAEIKYLKGLIKEIENRTGANRRK